MANGQRAENALHVKYSVVMLRHRRANSSRSMSGFKSASLRMKNCSISLERCQKKMPLRYFVASELVATLEQS